MFDQARNNLRNTSRRWADKSAKVYDRLSEQRICIGLTGLSGSGKSTFITSLLHQLRYHENSVLSSFNPALKGQLLTVDIRSPKHSELPVFDYDAGISALSSEPARWPAPTRNCSSTLIEIRYVSDNPRLFSRDPVRSVLIELRDYPGEWLLDLPLMEMDYASWSKQMLELLQTEPRRSLAPNLAEELLSIDPDSLFEPEWFDQLLERYRQALKVFKQAGLSQIQPGRLLVPSRHSDENYFLPLPVKAERPASLSWQYHMSRAYQKYRDEQVEPFYRHFFADLDRQVILVDLLGSLSRGEAYFNDQQLALEQILQSFNYGHRSWLGNLIGHRINKVVCVASKVDHLLPRYHDNARHIVGAMLAQANHKMKYSGVRFYCEAIAAVRSTSEQIVDGEQVLVGQYPGGVTAMTRHPAIEAKLPDAAFWRDSADWQLPPLLPYGGMDLRNGSNLPHIRLDTVLRELCDDLFE